MWIADLGTSITKMTEIYLQPNSGRTHRIDVDNFSCNIEADDAGYRIVIYKGEWDIEDHTVPYTGDTVKDLMKVEIYCWAYIQDYIDKLQRILDNLEVKW